MERTTAGSERSTPMTAVVAGGTQFPPGDRVQVLSEAIVPGKQQRQPEGKGPMLPPCPLGDDRLESLHGGEARAWSLQPERPSDHGGSASGFAPLAHVGSQPLADRLRRALPPPNPTVVFRPRRKPPRWTPCGIRVWL
ncbi:unnamed protein product [Arctia plantaginis]|uniref:Uncharacterized protein n=1 Tax=Arctia plantaginis TaxID=874455 RepID=A0A8S0ZE33_ARCPL|nr:unnamed protein product [Arctia plantaginis]